MRYKIVLRRNLLILALLMAAFAQVKAQYEPSFSHYWAMETSFNPAAVGKQDKINVDVAYNMSLLGFENNPKTMYASADLPFYFLGAYHGVGAKLVNDQIGLFAHNSIAIMYAVRLKMLGGSLSIGVQPTLIGEKFDGTWAQASTISIGTGMSVRRSCTHWLPRSSWAKTTKCPSHVHIISRREAIFD